MQLGGKPESRPAGNDVFVSVLISMSAGTALFVFGIMVLLT